MQTIQTANGIDIICQVMHDREDNKIIEFCSLTLGNLSRISDTVRDSILNQDILPIIIGRIENVYFIIYNI